MNWKILFGFVAVAVVLALFTNLAFQKSTLKAKIATCEATLASAREDTAVKALYECKQCQDHGRIEGYQQAQRDHDEVKRETEKLARPKCNPLVPPFFPCCDEDAQPGGITEEAFPTPKEFKARPALLTLSCAHVRNGGFQVMWVCGRNVAACVQSERREGACHTCYVHPASGRASGEDYAWTGHAIDEMDGPWTADGKKGVFP